MRAKSFFFLFFLPFGLAAQWTESFDGTALDLAWTGQRNMWILNQGRLQSNGPSVSGTCVNLSRAVELSDSFELQVLSSLNMATSSNNYLSFILSGPNHEWRIKLGGTPDEVSLYENGALVIDGMDKTLSSSSINALGIRLRVKSGWAELAICADMDTLNWIPQGSVFLDTFMLDSLLIEACYSSSNAHSFFIDDLRIGSILYDQIPPKLSRHYLKDHAWQLFFSEPMDTSEGQIFGPGNLAIPIQWINTKQALLLNLAQGDLLKFQGLHDRSGNLLMDTVLQLNDPKLAFREIQITELMADPSPAVGLPDMEWMEWMNSSGSDIELSFFQLMDASSSITLPDYLFPAKSYLIISSNCAVLKDYGPCLELPMSTSFLNNSGDDLFLIHRNGDTLESLHYSSSWYDDASKESGGYSLEKRDPLNPCLSDADNFTASTDPTGGTPGKVNATDERIDDHDAPIVMAFELLGSQTLRLVFSEALANIGAVIFEGDTLEMRLIQESEYQLLLANPLPENPLKVWKIRFEKMGDCAGNSLQDTSIFFRYALPEIPLRGDLIFTELLFLPTTQYAPFVEVYNRSEQALTLAGTSWGDEKTTRVLGNHLLYPGESLIFCKKADTSTFGKLQKEAVSSLPSFSRSGGLWLKNVEGQLIDAMYYADSFFIDGKGNAGAYSLFRMDSAKQCAGSNDWGVGSIPGGSPGKQDFKEVKYEEVQTELWQIYPLNATQLRLTYSSSRGIDPPEIEINSSGYAVDWQVWSTDFNSWVLTWSEAFLPNMTYQLTQKEELGCNGEMSSEQKRIFQVPGGTQGLRLNEILFDPIGDEPDYVECVNTGEEAIDLRGIFLGNYSSSGMIQDKVEFAPEGFLLMPGEYLLITEKEHLLGKHYPKYSPKNTLLVKQLPSYSNSGGGVMLFDSLGQVLDSFVYSPSMHSSLITVTKGVSLERIDPFLSDEQDGNWISASASENFGTPGYENSQMIRAVNNSKKHWTLASARFSPDGDGFEDQAILRYDGVEAGCTVSIRVHALNGALVCEWANNLPIGTAGQLLWEGQDGFEMPLADGPFLVLITWTARNGIKKTERLILVKASKH